MKLSLCLVLMLCLSAAHAFSQQEAGYSSLTYPHSIVSSGMGEQGAALTNAADAMQYNPANLVFTESGSASFFRNPLNMVGWWEQPPAITTAAMSLRLSNGVRLGVEYTNWSLGDAYFSTAENPAEGQRIHFYERSIAAAAAMPLGSEWAVGGEVRYAWMPRGVNDVSNDIMFSAGASYVPEAFGERLHAGVAFMNFGTPIEGPHSMAGEIQTDPVPAQIDLAADCAVVHHPLFDVTLALGFTKQIAGRNDAPDRSAQSSFRALFTDWKDLREVTAHAGFGYVWKPLPLGGGVSFFQEMYLGYFTVGQSSFYNSFFTHGARAGIEISGVKVAAGYAGRWHNNNPDRYISWTYPWESFQFTVGTDRDLFGSYGDMKRGADRLRGVLVTGGYAYCMPTGRMKEEMYGLVRSTFTGNDLWSLESDFYIDDDAAVIGTLAYARRNWEFSYSASRTYTFSIKIGTETAALGSGFRYHPVDAFHPFFVQASLGVMWINPYLETSPRYMYKTFDELAVGCAVPLGATGVVAMPKAGLRTLFMNSPFGGKHLLGYNQFELGMNLGYML